jgi:hypothetical protein
MAKWLVGIGLVGSALLFGTKPALAQEMTSAAAVSVPKTDAPPQERVVGKSWYGWQTLTIDVGAGSLAWYGKQTKDGRDLPVGSMILSLGASGLVLGAPIAHFAHGRVRTGALSMGMRVGLPAAGLGIAALAGAKEDATFGALALGMATASILDATLLAWKPQVETKRVSITPTAAWDGARGGTVGVVGAF